MKFGLNSFALKIIALTSMVIDHVGAVLFPKCLAFRIIGRLAFPIYAFLIVEGFCHTHDVKKYMARLTAFAILSEVPFDLAFYGKCFEFSHQNVFFTLLLGVLLLYFYSNQQSTVGKAGYMALFLLMGELMRTDYGMWGVLMIFCFYLYRENIQAKIISIAAIQILVLGGVQSYAIAAIIPIAFYNGEKGPGWKYFFYAAYPLHLLILFGIKMILQNGGM